MNRYYIRKNLEDIIEDKKINKVNKYCIYYIRSLLAYKSTQDITENEENILEGLCCMSLSNTEVRSMLSKYFNGNNGDFDTYIRLYAYDNIPGHVVDLIKNAYFRSCC